MKILKSAMEKQLLNICEHGPVKSLEVGSGGGFCRFTKTLQVVQDRCQALLVLLYLTTTWMIKKPASKHSLFRGWISLR